MKRFRIVQIVVLLTAALAVVAAQTVERADESQEAFTPVFETEWYDAPWITGDTNQDGNVDYALRLDEFGEKAYEAMDFNFDGLMDDFYMYRGGVLSAEQLDTNFDGRIDLWIHMHDGVRVRGYERDLDYDGAIDLVKEFGES